MNYDGFSPLVLQVVEFFGSGKVLANPVPTEAIDFSIVEGISKAKKMAWETTFGDSELTWSDIRGQQMAHVWGIVYKTKGYQELDHKLCEVLGMVEKGIALGLGKTTFCELLDDVVGDFRACLYSRAFEGRTSEFHESVFRAYACGGWPCGWSGNYPDGMLAVYFP